MAFGPRVMSVVPDILDNDPRITRTEVTDGINMPKTPCQPGCTCGLHNRLGLSPEELKERKRAQSANRSRQYQAGVRSQVTPKREGKPCSPECTCKRHSSAAWERGNRGASQRRWQQENPLTPEQRRATHLKHRFGLTLDDWAQMLADQHGCCYLCSEPLDTETPRAIHVDHDHSCCRGDKTCGNCIRGLACDPCNKGIGHFGDDPDRMERVAARLRAANTKIAARRESRDELPANVRRIKRQEAS